MFNPKYKNLKSTIKKNILWVRIKTFWTSKLKCLQQNKFSHQNKFDFFFSITDDTTRKTELLEILFKLTWLIKWIYLILKKSWFVQTFNIIKVQQLLEWALDFFKFSTQVHLVEKSKCKYFQLVFEMKCITTRRSM